MEPEAKYTVVGAVALALVAALIAAVAWLAASGQKSDAVAYRIYFTRQSLEGLQLRSDVRMKGIRVGAVKGFSLSPRVAGAVEVTIEVDPTTPVKESTRAVVDRNLVTGVAAIRLQNTREDSPLLTVAPAGEREPVIAEGASQLQQFSETVGELATRADETLRRVNATLSPENVAALSETLAHLRAASLGAGQTLKHLDTTLASVGRAADAAATSTRTLGADVHRLSDRYDALGAETTTAVRNAAGSVQKLSDDVSLLARRSEELLIDSDLEIRMTGQQLRSTADAVGVAARKLRDPRVTLFGPADSSLGPGEERR